MLGVTLHWLASHPGGVAIFLAASCYRNRVKRRPDGPPGSYADFTFTFTFTFAFAFTFVKIYGGY